MLGITTCFPTLQLQKGTVWCKHFVSREVLWSGVLEEYLPARRSPGTKLLTYWDSLLGLSPCPLAFLWLPMEDLALKRPVLQLFAELDQSFHGQTGPSQARGHKPSLLASHSCCLFRPLMCKWSEYWRPAVHTDCA